MTLPTTFPTPDGKLQLEWSNGNYDISLSVHLDAYFTSKMHILDFGTDKEESMDLTLKVSGDQDGWSSINDKIGKLIP